MNTTSISHPSPPVGSRPVAPLVYPIDDYDFDQFLDVARSYGNSHFGYAVTPNVDHLIRYHEESAFRSLYADAEFILLDSRFAAKLMRLLRGVKLPVCAGSDLTEALFHQVIGGNDRIVLVGSSAAQAQMLRERFGLRDLHHYNPPMGFVKDPKAVEATLRYVEAASPFRYCFIAVGSPQQEVVAQQLLKRGTARGLALCIGASIDFITGAERRAPGWMQHSGLEWIYRLSQNPRRLARRYLVRGPRFFRYLSGSQIDLRPAVARRT